MIRLENLVKKFPGQETPAVNNINIEIPEGKICIFIGPSGCGKTTTLRMINGLIKPSGGAVYIGNENVTDQDQVLLRRKIGYVIQGTGLFPHMTIADNVGIVPKLLKWPKEKIRSVVDDLLALVDLEPNEFRDRYPKELSGGQAQRVGVARALAADPPVLLMDEPFGAIDPITRDVLQKQLLDIQKKIQKTIVFVTHDIDEAIEMGDLILLLKDGEVVQYDTPKALLDKPKDEFVSQFVGADRALKGLSLITVENIIDRNIEFGLSTETVKDAKALIKKSGNNFVFIIDNNKKPVGYIMKDDLKDDSELLSKIVRKQNSSIHYSESVKNALSRMISLGFGNIFVVDDSGKVLGIVTLKSLMNQFSN